MVQFTGARPAGEGVYGMLRKGDNTYLSYVLEMPKEMGEVQEAFNIQHEGAFIVTVKNPEIPSGFTGGKKPEYPEHLMKHFQGKTTGRTMALTQLC